MSYRGSHDQISEETCMICPLTNEQELILSLLPILDDLERGIDAMESAYLLGDSSLISHIKGLKMVKDKLESTLQNYGVEAIPFSLPFSTKTMEAVGRVMDNSLPIGSVANVIQKGYQKDGKVIRYAKVIVSY